MSTKTLKEQATEIITEGKAFVVGAWQEEPVMFLLYLGLILFVIGAIIVGICEPGFEAHSFNKLTGGHASYWDALWINLRVDCSGVIK